jgi:hypothetical protein
MRFAVAFAALAAVLLFQSPASQAGPGAAPWCSYVNTGMYNVTEYCIYRSFEQCRGEVLAGNRGFCNVNPRFQAAVEPVKRSAKRRTQAY